MKKYAQNIYNEATKSSPVENHLSDDRSTTIPLDRESMKVLMECLELQRKKSRDYQNQNSSVVQAMHYRRGVDTIHDVMHGKMLRAQSLLESGSDPNFESLEDTYKDLINYASFAVAWLRGKMEGQDLERDIFNKKKS
jgi:hypothetical protein